MSMPVLGEMDKLSLEEAGFTNVVSVYFLYSHITEMGYDPRNHLLHGYL